MNRGKHFKDASLRELVGKAVDLQIAPIPEKKNKKGPGPGSQLHPDDSVNLPFDAERQIGTGDRMLAHYNLQEGQMSNVLGSPERADIPKNVQLTTKNQDTLALSIMSASNDVASTQRASIPGHRPHGMLNAMVNHDLNEQPIMSPSRKVLLTDASPAQMTARGRNMAAAATVGQHLTMNQSLFRDPLIDGNNSSAMRKDLGITQNTALVMRENANVPFRFGDDASREQQPSGLEQYNYNYNQQSYQQNNNNQSQSLYQETLQMPDKHGGKTARSLQPRAGSSRGSTQTGLQTTVQVSEKLQMKNRNNTQTRSTAEKNQLQLSDGKAKQQFDISNYLEAAEVDALRRINPHNKTFETHLGKVLQSVSNRRRGQGLATIAYYQPSSNQIIDPRLQQSQMFQGPNSDSKLDTEYQMPLPLSAPDDMSMHKQLVPFESTPQAIRSQARRELQNYTQQDYTLAKGQKPMPVIKNQMKDEFVPQISAVRQVTNLLDKLKVNKDRVFIPVTMHHDPRAAGFEFKEHPKQNIVQPGGVVFSQGGFVTVAADKNQPSDVVTKEEYIMSGVETMIINQLPFVRKFLSIKVFRQWKILMLKNVYERNRQKLAKNLIFSKPVISQKFQPWLIPELNRIRFLEFVEAKPSTQYGKHQQSEIEERCEKCCSQSKHQIEDALLNVLVCLKSIRKEIVADDTQFLAACKKHEEHKIITQDPKRQELVPFSTTAKVLKHEADLHEASFQRQLQYNSLVLMTARIIQENLMESMFINKKQFTHYFCQERGGSQFELSMCFNQMGNHDTEPTKAEHRALFQKLFQMMEESIYRNQQLIFYCQDLSQLFFQHDKKVNPPGTLMMRSSVSTIEKWMKKNQAYFAFDQRIQTCLDSDFKRLDQEMSAFSSVEDIENFFREWKHKSEQQAAAAASGSGGVSLEMGFYKETWSKMDEFHEIIDSLPATQQKCGRSVLLETATIKKYLSDIPRIITESIRHNVTQTMETETKLLKEELNNASEVLDQPPVKLETYMHQINMLKYLKQQEEKIKSQFGTIMSLRQQCKSDNIKFTFNLELAIQEVEKVYENLPKLKTTASENLKKERSNMERFIFQSQQKLTNSILSYQKQHIRTYMQDVARLDNCAETLEEIIKRGLAIQEMKQRVLMYKESLKTLYEDEPDAEKILKRKPLKCAEEMEKTEEIHKHTVKLWEVLRYWKKKRHQCYNKPFLELDIGNILKSIAKVQKFFDFQLPQHKLIEEMSQPIMKVIKAQVKDTSIIVEYVKDLHKDVLQPRHWTQIFTLLKANHLKQSRTFTIVELKEYNIQNQSESIQKIIDHANTEAKFENVFRAISRQWEQSTLKIIPFKESMDDYILTNSELMQEAIEENVATLNKIAKSQYAAHVAEDIHELKDQLIVMLDHLQVWTTAQKYWLTLDPVYNSGLFKNFFGENTRDFYQSRQEFRRIMWSSFRNPLTVHNLLIADRTVCFHHLINFYASLQKKVNEFLEQKRLAFTRFYFLNDAQLLEFFSCVVGNRDFSVFVNMMFTGAQKLYATRLLMSGDPYENLGKTPAHVHERITAGAHDLIEGDYEAILEKFIHKARSEVPLKNPSYPNFEKQKVENSLQESTMLKGTTREDANLNSLGDNYNPSIDSIHSRATPSHFDTKNFDMDYDPLISGIEKVTFKELDPIFKSQSQDLQHDDSKTKEQSRRKDQRNGAFSDTVTERTSRDDSRINTGKKSDIESRLIVDSEEDAEDASIAGEVKQFNVFRDQINPVLNQDSTADVKAQENTQDMIILGLVSPNKELFLFDRHVSMSQSMETWLSETQGSMQESIRKQILNAVQRFPVEPLEDWALDYPQQVTIQVVHLILSQEVTDILTRIDSSNYKKPEEKKKETEEGEKTEGQASQEKIPAEGGGEKKEGEAVKEATKSQQSSRSGGSKKEGDKNQTDSTKNINPNAMPLNKAFETPGYQDLALTIGKPQEDPNKKDLSEKPPSQAGGDTVSNLGETTNMPKKIKPPKKKQDPNSIPKTLRKRLTFEPPMDQTEEQLMFMDDAFGEGANMEGVLEEAVQQYRKDEQRAGVNMTSMKRNALLIRKADYKEQILNVLQHRSLNSLALRLQFWINKVMKVLYKRRFNLKNKQENMFAELPGIQKLHLKSLVLFLKHQQEIVYDLIRLRVTEVNDFEWQSKLRLKWNSNDNEAEAMCGGWSQRLGYEYLGTQPRLMLTPITQRYFLFISSALREKSSVMLQTSNFQLTTHDTVKELADMCSIPYKSVQCGHTSNISGLVQFLNGAAMADTWVLFEHMDKCSQATFEILTKEIQLLQEQFIISNFNRNQLLSQIAKHFNSQNNGSGGINETDQSAPDFLQSQSYQGLLAYASQNLQSEIPLTMKTLGIFGSTSYRLGLNQTPHAREFWEKTKSTYRTLALVKPKFGKNFTDMLHVENFTEYKSLGMLVMRFFTKFIDYKDRVLYQKQIPHRQEDLDDEEPQAHNTYALDYPNLKMAVKLAVLQRNQEFNAFYAKKIKDVHGAKKERQDNRDVRVFQDVMDNWVIKFKRKEDYFRDRKEIKDNEEEVLVAKYKIEVDALRDASRAVLKQKYLREFTEVKMRENEIANAQGGAKSRRQAFEIKNVELALEECIDQAFQDVVTEKLAEDAERIRVQALREQMDLEEAADQAKKDKQKPDDPINPQNLNRARKRMPISRRDSLVDYKPSNKSMTLVARATGPNKDDKLKRRSTVRHSSYIDLTFAQVRKEQEEKFELLFQEGIKKVAREFDIVLTDDQMYNCMGLIETMKRNKGIVIVGPVCSGKTQLIKLITLCLKTQFETQLRTSYISPKTFSENDLYGPVLAYDQNSVYSYTQALQPKSVFQLVLNTFAKEKMLMKKQETNRLIQGLYIDQEELNPEIADCFITFFKNANLREREYLWQHDFLLDFNQGAEKVVQGGCDSIPVRFPNANITQFPSDLFIFFETLSLKDVPPSFLNAVGVVHTQSLDVNQNHIFERQLKTCERKFKPLLEPFGVDVNEIRKCCDYFVLPFIKKLDNVAMVYNWPLWDMRALTNQMYVQLNAQLYVLEKFCITFSTVEDQSEFNIREEQREVMWNIVLVAVTWSFGAVLNQELRKLFDDQFSQFKSQFNIGFSVPMKQKFTLFDIFYDIERLAWGVMADKLEYKLKQYFEPGLQALLLPTPEIAQAFFMIDNQLQYMRRDKDLNKQFRLIGPSCSSKTVILHTFHNKMKEPVKAVTVPMTAYLTLERFKEKVEENYMYKRAQTLIPKEEDKRLLFVIDDIHLQKNLKVDLLEYIRSWCTCDGYFDVPKGVFKKIGQFGCVMAENSHYNSQRQIGDGGQNRFVYYSTTLWCMEITNDSFKSFVQTWLTTSQWPQSEMMLRFYVLTSNALIALIDKMKQNKNVFNTSSMAELYKFSFVSRFCANLVLNCCYTTQKEDVFGAGLVQYQGYDAKREEDAVAEMFAYEAMRTFGDRIMRPSARALFSEKLAQVLQKEFLCSEEDYNTEVMEQIVMGDFWSKPKNAPMKMLSLISQNNGHDAKKAIQHTAKKHSGNPLLGTLVDAPNGLIDLHRVCRILVKPGQHLIMVGPSGSSKSELVQLAACLGETPLMEVNAPPFGEPLQFAYAVKQIILSVVKFNSETIMVLSDQTIRDPVYYDYMYNLLTCIARQEEFVLFDKQFYLDLCAIEAQHVKKIKNLTVPEEPRLFRQAVQKIQKKLHIVFLWSDLITYTEIINMYPQMEYLCEVLFIDDLTPLDYQEMTNTFLHRSNVQEESDGRKAELAISFVEVRKTIKEKLLKTFYSPKMLSNCVYELGKSRGFAEFIFTDPDLINGNIFAQHQLVPFRIADAEFHQTMLNIPLEVFTLNKHRYGMLLEVFRFLYDLLSMHISIRKAYYTTFLDKSEQFSRFFNSVKDTKSRLHNDQNLHNFKLNTASDKSNKLKKDILEQQMSIKKKEQQIQELEEEMQVQEEEVDAVIDEKNLKLERLMNQLTSLDQEHFTDFVTSANQVTEAENHLLKTLQILMELNADKIYSRKQVNALFIRKSELFQTLEERRLQSIPKDVFMKLNEFVSARVSNDYTGKSPILLILYNFMVELFRKLNIKETLANVFHRIMEVRTQIDANIFSINYSKKSIEEKSEDLKMQGYRIKELTHAGGRLSKKIEEAEISHMRTQQVYGKIQEYADHMQRKLNNVESRAKSILGDSLLLAVSVVYLGGFAPEEREQIRAELIEYLSKIRHLEFNKMWIDYRQNGEKQPSNQTTQQQQQQQGAFTTANPRKSIFIQVLKDLGLRDFVHKHNLPDVLSKHQFGEALFSILFAPSCPVVIDPTGVVQDFIKNKLLINTDVKTISGADVSANEKLEQNFIQNRASLLTDVNFQGNSTNGLSHNHALFRRMASSLYNGIDFDGRKSAQVKKLGTYDGFFTHYNGLNKRLPLVPNSLEHLSIFQAMIFQSRFEFLLNREYLQNATFVCATPSLVVENRTKMDDNFGIVRLKEMLMEHLLPDSYDFAGTKHKLKFLNDRIIHLERHYENVFLVASSETLKNLSEYSELRTAVEDIIDAREQKDYYLKKYRVALQMVRIVTEASDVLFQMYLASKQVAKLSGEVTYDWHMYCNLVESLLVKCIGQVKSEAVEKRKQQAQADMREVGEDEEIELEIDNTFFKQRFVPIVHQTLMSSILTSALPLFNLLLSLRLAQTYKQINHAEHVFILKRFTELDGFKKWREADHQFVKLSDSVDKNKTGELRTDLLQLYPDASRLVFDQIERNLGKNYKYKDASLFLYKGDLKRKFNLSQIQQLTFGFLCPDQEFKSKLTMFMYSQIMATFDFTEQLLGMDDFLANGNYKGYPIALKCQPNVNPINLVTTLAHKASKPLILIRTDPMWETQKQGSKLFNQKLNERICSQLNDFANIGLQADDDVNFSLQQHSGHHRESEVATLVREEQLSKWNWLRMKSKDVNLDQGRVIFEQPNNGYERSNGKSSSDLNEINPHVSKICQAARDGNWVIIVPIVFPQYMSRVQERLQQMRDNNEIHNDFRLIIDLQNLNSNEYPDSFLSSQSIIFNLSEKNYDRITTFNDIWSHILNPKHLQLLTDLDENNLKKLKQLQVQDLPGQSTDLGHSERFVDLFEREAANDFEKVQLFNQFVERSKTDFNAKLKQQIAYNQRKKQEEKDRLAAEEQAKIKAEAERKAKLASQAMAQINEEEDAEYGEEESPGLRKQGAAQASETLIGAKQSSKIQEPGKLQVQVSENVLDEDMQDMMNEINKESGKRLTSQSQYQLSQPGGQDSKLSEPSAVTGSQMLAGEGVGAQKEIGGLAPGQTLMEAAQSREQSATDETK